MEPTSTNIVNKNMLKNHLKIIWLSNRFFFEIQLILESFSGGWDLQNLVNRIGGIAKFWKSHDVTLEVEKVSFRIDLGVILAPSWGPKSNQNREKGVEKVMKKWWWPGSRKSRIQATTTGRAQTILDPGEEEGGGVNHSSRVGGWRMELERIERVGGMEDETKTLNHLSP